MSFAEIITNKPVLIGLHLGFAILAIDLFLWLAGEIIANSAHRTRLIFVSLFGVVSFVLSWIAGGYYYVVYYGPLVKPVIKAGNAPWAHGIAMEAKEHVFLFLIPLAVTICLLARLNSDELQSLGLRKRFIQLTAMAAGLGLSLGLMGYIISAAARWGVNVL